MWDTFLKHIDICPENTQILDGNAVGLQAECDAFEETIKAAGRDWAVCWRHGPWWTHCLLQVRLQSVVQDPCEDAGHGHHPGSARFFSGNLTKVPTMALTVGMGTDCHGARGDDPHHRVLRRLLCTRPSRRSEPYVDHVCLPTASPGAYPHDEDATLELKVKIIKYFRDLKLVHNKLVDPPVQYQENKQRKPAVLEAIHWLADATCSLKDLTGTGGSLWRLSLGGQNCFL